MKNLERLVAEKLLKIKAIKLQPANPFTWASGWKSPFYCCLLYTSCDDYFGIFKSLVIKITFDQCFGTVYGIRSNLHTLSLIHI